MTISKMLKILDLPKENVYNIKKLKDGSFSVTNSKKKTYFITQTYKGLKCDCPNSRFRREKNCKHKQMIRGWE